MGTEGAATRLPSGQSPIPRAARLACALWFAWAPTAMADAELDKMRAKVRAEFPSVHQISTEALAAWLADPNRPAPALLDVRTEAEFAVSHLPGARRIDPDASPAQVLAAIRPNTAAIVYCSVGYRSSRLAKRLQTAGVADVSNLDGSIFQWANEGRTLHQAGEPAKFVHPYNKTFGKALKEEYRAKVPPVKG